MCLSRVASVITGVGMLFICLLIRKAKFIMTNLLLVIFVVIVAGKNHHQCWYGLHLPVIWKAKLILCLATNLLLVVALC